MSKHILSVGMSLSAAIFCVAALPLVSGAIADGDHLNAWAQRVDAFEQARVNAITHDYPAQLAMLNAPSTPLTPYQRDAAQTSLIPKLDNSLLTASQTAADKHQCLAEAVYYEARSETYAGQKAVAEVVLNRVSSKHFPNTLCGVVYQGSERSTGCQFSFTCDGSMDIAPTGKAWERSVKVANHVLLGAHIPTTQNATHYHTVNIYPKWADYVKPTRIIGSHKFYKFKNRRELAMTQSVAP